MSELKNTKPERGEQPKYAWPRPETDAPRVQGQRELWAILAIWHCAPWLICLDTILCVVYFAAVHGEGTMAEILARFG